MLERTIKNREKILEKTTKKFIKEVKKRMKENIKRGELITRLSLDSVSCGLKNKECEGMYQNAIIQLNRSYGEDLVKFEIESYGFHNSYTRLKGTILK